MDNLKLPAYPSIAYDTVQRGDGLHIPIQYTDGGKGGFTKLELASLMIAQGMAAASIEVKIKAGIGYGNSIERYSVELAKAVLEEANK